MAEVTMSERDVQDLGAYRYLGATPGELAKKIADLERDNQKERDKAKGFEEKAKLAPPEGAVVLIGDDLAAYEAFKALGIAPGDVERLKTERDDLAKKDAERSRKDAFSAAVEALKWPKDIVDTLLDMRSLDGATVEVKTEKFTGKDGKQEDVQVPYLTLAGEGQKAQRFADYAAETPQLKGIRTEAGTTQQETSRLVPDQRGGGGNNQPVVSGGIDDMIAANQAAAKAGNATVPRKAAA